MHATSFETVQRTTTFPVDRRRVFRAWTTPEELKAWWRPGAYITKEVSIDLRVGGSYRIVMQHASGSIATVAGKYLHVEAPSRLVMTWVSEGGARDDGTESLLTVEFLDRGNSTELRLTHDHLSAGTGAGFDSGWTAVLTHLIAFCSNIE